MKSVPFPRPCALLAAFAVTLTAAAGAQRPEGYSREVEGVLRGMLAAYRDADSYRDHGRLTVLQQTGRVRQITKMPSATTYRRPGELHVLGGMQSVTSDGKQMQIVLDALRQFQRASAPSRLTMEHVRMGAPGAGLDQGYPEVLEFLLGEDVLPRWIAQMRKVAILNQAKPAQVAGRECVTVSYETVHGAEINLFIDARTMLLLRADIDNTRAQRSAHAPRQAPGTDAPRLQVVLQLDPVETDVGMEDALFALSDPAAEGMRLVETFEAQAPGQTATAAPATPESLIGKAAPSFEVTTDEGQTLTQHSFLTKPALLFFWSPDAGPGNLAAVQMVERLRAASNGGTAFLGIASAGSNTKTVSDLLAAKKAAYASALDSDGEFARRYNIASLPAWVVIGADGNVLHTTSGDPRDAEKELAQHLENAAASIPAPVLTNHSTR